jgi:uncharacterized protein YkwD
MKYYATLILSMFLLQLSAQSPTDLNSDVGQDANYWANNVSSNSDLETTFNNARRAEETQLSLSSNSLGNLSLPIDWTSLTDDEKVLFLMNAERTCRAGVDYGSGAVLGLPFEGVESLVDAAAQAHADDQVANNTFSHTGSDNSTPFSRIDTAVGTSCHSFMSYAENLAAFFTSGTANTFVAEHAVYDWLYEDLSSAWGHRRAAFIQDADDYSATGFTNDYGDASSEGFIGVGIASSPSYNPNSFGGVNDGDLVVFSVFDPVSSGGCTYINLLTGLEVSFEGPSALSVYPNPSSDRIFVDGLSADASVKIVNNMGLLVYSSFSEFDLIEIDVAAFPAGMYFVIVNSDVIKIVIN